MPDGPDLLAFEYQAAPSYQAFLYLKAIGGFQAASCAFVLELHQCLCSPRYCQVSFQSPLLLGVFQSRRAV